MFVSLYFKEMESDGSKFYVLVKEPAEEEWLGAQVKSGDLKGTDFLCKLSKSHFWEFSYKIWVMITAPPSTQPSVTDQNTEDQTVSLPTAAENLLIANLRLESTLGKVSIMISLRDQLQ